MPKDCVILVADADTEQAVQGLLSRPMSLGCRSFQYDVYRHIGRDPGVRLEAADFLRSFAGAYANAMVILDKHGSGAEQFDRATIEVQIEAGLQATWQNRAVAVVIAPKVEAWVWSDSPQVE